MKNIENIFGNDMPEIVISEKGKYSISERKDLIRQLIGRGFEIFTPQSSTFGESLMRLGYSLNVLKGKNDVKNGYGTDVTQCDSRNKRIDVAGNYLKKEKGFNNFKDSAYWTIHELFHVWIESDFSGLNDDELKTKFYLMKKDNDKYNRYPFNFDEWLTYGAQFKFSPESFEKVVREKGRMHRDGNSYLTYNFFRTI